jgi:hypothetical protein
MKHKETKEIAAIRKDSRGRDSIVGGAVVEDVKPMLAERPFMVASRTVGKFNFSVRNAYRGSVLTGGLYVSVRIPTSGVLPSGMVLDRRLKPGWTYKELSVAVTGLFRVASGWAKLWALRAKVEEVAKGKDWDELYEGPDYNEDNWTYKGRTMVYAEMTPEDCWWWMKELESLKSN